MNKKKIENFKKFLSAHGAEVLTETNKYELVRFKANGKVSVIYEGKRGISFVGEAEAAHNKFENIGKADWSVDIKRSRKNLGVKERTLLERDGNKCFYCGEEIMDEHMSVEHLLALIHGGNNHISNLVLAHKSCNQKVGHMSVIDKIKYRENQIFHAKQ